MPFTGALLILLAIHSPFTVDSTIFAVDINNEAMREQNLHGSIIDYCIDDYLYVLTKRYLYKLDPDDLHIVDRTLLPQTYTSMCTNQAKILLISSGEVVILTKSHLAYETGIGLQPGDLRLLVSPQGRTIAPDGTSLYVIEDKESVSILKIIDLVSGSTRKTLRVPRIVMYVYNANTRSFTTFDIHNRLITYDLNFMTITTTPVPFAIDWFLPQATGFYIGTHFGFYLITIKGAIIDFQPLVMNLKQSFEDFVFITDRNIVRLDSLTLRTDVVTQNQQHIIQIFSIDHPSYVIGMNHNHQFYFIHTNTMNILPRAEYEPITMEIEQHIIPEDRDSLWYLQLGAFSNITNALNMYNEFRVRAIPVFIETTEVYRVKFGGFSDKQLGVYVADKLHLNGWFSLQYQVSSTENVNFFVENETYIYRNGRITRSKP